MSNVGTDLIDVTTYFQDEKKLKGKELDDLITKCISFGELLINKKIFEYQKIAARQIFKAFLGREGCDVVCLISRQSGKTEIVGMVISVILVLIPALSKFIPELKIYENGVKVGSFAPINDQIDTLTNRIKGFLKTKSAVEILGDEDINVRLVPGEGDISLSNGSFYTARSCAPNTKLESKTYDIIFTDESQSIDSDKFLISIRPMLAFTAGCCVMTGTPYPNKSEFYFTCNFLKKKRSEYYLEFDYKYCSKFNPNYKKFVDGEIEKYGLDSDYVRMMYRLHWVFERGLYITEEFLEPVLDKGLQLLRRDKGKNDSLKKCVAGLDLGKKADSTVLTIGEYDYSNVDDWGIPKKKIYNWLEMLGDDYESQYDQILSFLQEYPNLEAIIVDATGLGEVVCDNLERRFYDNDLNIEVIRVYFNNVKSKLANNVYTHIFRENLTIPGHKNAKKSRNWKRFYDQTTSLVKGYSSQGKLEVTHDSGKESHDDYFYSLALFLWYDESDSPEIEVEENFLCGRAK